MITYTEKLLGMKVDRKDQRLLSNQAFAKLKADEFVLGPPESWDDDYIVEDCSFSNCIIKPGPLMIMPGVQLRRVIFDDMRAKDKFTISLGACLLDHVTIRGQLKSAGLWFRAIDPPAGVDHTPLKARINGLASTVELMLDISQFDGPSVEVLGLPEEKVLINKSRHVVIQRSMRIDWKSLGFPNHSLWRQRLRRLEILELDVGIYHIPSQQENDVAFREFEILRKNGLL
jgi:hypothetical protein